MAQILVLISSLPSISALCGCWNKYSALIFFYPLCTASVCFMIRAVIGTKTSFLFRIKEEGKNECHIWPTGPGFLLTCKREVIAFEFQSKQPLYSDQGLLPESITFISYKIRPQISSWICQGSILLTMVDCLLACHRYTAWQLWRVPA